jgi:hypothetical protein
MANRMIKDSIRTSKSVNNMSDFQFRLWVYLITYVDDYGRGSADPELLKGFVFPRRKGVTESSIRQALADLANSGSVSLYEVDGEPYFCFPNWGDHQRIQTKRSKFPAPEDGIILESTVGHGESRWVTVSHGESPPETETKPNFKTETETKHSGGGGEARAQEAIDDFCAGRGIELDNFLGMTDKLKGELQALADALFDKFAGRAPNTQDVVNVYLSIHKNDRKGNISIDRDKRDLLCYAFEAAANAGKAGDWNYIRGVLLRMQQRGIKTLSDAEDFDLDRKA